MTKDPKKLNPSNIVFKFPTLTHFQKIIDPIVNSNKPPETFGPIMPTVPDYLREMDVTVNPFSEIKMHRIKELKKLEDDRKKFEKKLILNNPPHKTVNRSTRIKFNANYHLKKLKYDLTIKEMLQKLKADENHERKVSKPKKFISNTEFLIDKRRICLLDLAINIKKEQYLELDEIIKEEEQYIQNENERLRKINETHDQYIKVVCQNTSDAIKIADKETHKKNKISEMVKRAQYNMAHLNAECVKLEEEYLKLKTYKEFLRNCHKQRERKQALERTSLMNELKIDAILKEVEMERTHRSQDSEDGSEMNFKSKKFNMFNVSNSNERPISNNNEVKEDSPNSNEPHYQKPISFTKEQLEKLKTMILLGFSNSSNDDNISEVSEMISSQIQVVLTPDDDDDGDLDANDLLEDDLFFEDPQDLIDVLSELEVNNLSLIENVQEQEEMCDQMKQRIENIKRDMNQQMSQINKHIVAEKEKIYNLEDSINCINETEKFLNTFNDLERYKKIFYFGETNLKTPDEMMDYLHDKISILYHSVFEKVDSSKSNTLEMLCRLEILIDALYVELQSHDKSIVLKAKKQVDERKREAARLRQKQFCIDAEQLKIQKAMANALMPPRYSHGRKVVYRSEPFKQVIRVNKIDSVVLRNQEENAFFFDQ